MNYLINVACRATRWRVTWSRYGCCATYSTGGTSGVAVPGRLLDGDPDHVEGGGLVGALHHRDAVRTVTRPRGALRGAALGSPATWIVTVSGARRRAVLGREEELRDRGRVGSLVGALENPAGGVEVPARMPAR